MNKNHQIGDLLWDDTFDGEFGIILKIIKGEHKYLVKFMQDGDCDYFTEDGIASMKRKLRERLNAEPSNW